MCVNKTIPIEYEAWNVIDKMVYIYIYVYVCENKNVQTTETKMNEWVITIGIQVWRWLYQHK